MKRILLFLGTNILVMFTIMVIVSITGAGRFISGDTLQLAPLMVYSLIIGFTGSIISLMMSRFMAKFSYGIKPITPETARNDEEAWLVATVYAMAARAGMRVMPEVGIYDSGELNAFATGPSKNKALVAVSSGLLYRLDKGSVEGVIGHEIAHIVNGDMVTMTLLQGIVNTFVTFFANIAAWAVAQAVSKGEDEEGGMSYAVYGIVRFIFSIVFMILGSIIVMWFSRVREYSADKGGAEFAGKENMISALEALKRNFGEDDPRYAAAGTYKISSGSKFLSLFSTHPDLDDRIEKLKNLP